MDLKWIQMCLFLSALLQFEAFQTRNPHRIVRVGDDVTLFCENVIEDQPGCSYTTWVYSDPSNSAGVELVTRGDVINAGAKSGRLNITDDCSLIIKNVTDEDVGRYECEQYPTTERQEPTAVVFLSVLTMTETKNRDDVTLGCYVRMCELCRFRVKWLYEGKDVEKQDINARPPSNICYTDKTFETDEDVYKSRYNSLECDVSVGNMRLRFLFRLSDKSNNPKKPQTTTTQRPNVNHVTAESGPVPEKEDASHVSPWLYVAVAEPLCVALLIIVVKVIRWKRTQGNQTQRNDDAVNPEDAYATISFTNKSNGTARVQRKAGGGDQGPVTYATVKPSSPSSPPPAPAADGVSAEPRSLYININNTMK